MTNEIVKIPSLSDLIKEDSYEENALMVILNQPPPDKWLKEHPMIKVKSALGATVPLKFLPRERIEYMLTRIYGKWWVEVRSVQLIANSPTVTVRLYVRNPITGETEWNDGVGASPIQVNKDAGAADFNAMKSAGVQMAAPAAETYAFKDAAEKFGKIFGKDLNVSEIDYNSLLKEKPTNEVNEIPEELINIISEADKDSLAKIYNTNKEYHTNPKFMQLLNKRREQLNSNQ